MTLPHDRPTAPAPSGQAPSRVRLWLLAAAALAVIPGMVLAWCIVAGAPWPQSTDDAVRRAVLPLVEVRPAVVTVSTWLRVLGGGVMATVIATSATLLLAWRRRWAAAVFVACCGLGGVLMNTALKQVVDRPRATEPPPLALEDSLSFPSGHAMAAVYVFGAIGIVAWRAGDRWSRALAVLLWVTGLAISVSRVLLGVHYVSDIVAAWSFAAAWVLVVAAVVLVGRDGRPLAGPLDR